MSLVVPAEVAAGTEAVGDRAGAAPSRRWARGLRHWKGRGSGRERAWRGPVKRQAHLRQKPVPARPGRAQTHLQVGAERPLLASALFAHSLGLCSDFPATFPGTVAVSYEHAGLPAVERFREHLPGAPSVRASARRLTSEGADLLARVPMVQPVARV